MEPNDLLPSLCNLTSFVTNADPAIIRLSDTSPQETAAFSSLLRTGAEIERLELVDGGHVLSESLAQSIRHSLVRSLSVTIGFFPSPETERLISESMGEKLISLEISHVQICCKGSGAFTSAIKRCKSLHEIRLQNFTIEDPTEFTAAMLQAKALNSLRLLQLRLDDLTLGMILDRIGGLSELVIKYSIAGENTMAAIGRMSGLTKLDLNYNSLCDNEVDTLAKGFRSCALQVLRLSRNDIGPAGAASVSQLILRSPRLRSRYLQKPFRRSRREEAGRGPRRSLCKGSPQTQHQQLQAGSGCFCPVSPSVWDRGVGRDQDEQ